MKPWQLLVAGAVVVGGYSLMQSTKQSFQQTLYDFVPFSATVQTATQATTSAAKEFSQAINTPGGLVGEDSFTDPSYSWEQVQKGINTPGGLLGAQSATDIGYQLGKLFGW